MEIRYDMRHCATNDNLHQRRVMLDLNCLFGWCSYSSLHDLKYIDYWFVDLQSAFGQKIKYLNAFSLHKCLKMLGVASSSFVDGVSHILDHLED